MITNDQEWAVTQQRIRQFHALLLQLRQSETAENYALMATAYLLELDKMNDKIWRYLVRLLYSRTYRHVRRSFTTALPVLQPRKSRTEDGVQAAGRCHDGQRPRAWAGSGEQDAAESAASLHCSQGSMLSHSDPNGGECR